MFQIDRLRCASRKADLDDEPFALIETEPRGLSISAVNKKALGLGIQPGQMLADARAIIPGLITQAAEHERDAQMLRRLALWLGRYGPQRNVFGKNALWVDITGVEHLFGGEERLLKDCHQRLSEFGFDVRIGLADTRRAALALAQYGTALGQAMIIAPEGDVREAIAGLPVDALQLDDAATVLLYRLGLKKIGQLYVLPRAALVRRFREVSPGGGRRLRSVRVMKGGRKSASHITDTLILRLDQMLGEINEPVPALVEPPVFRIQRAYAEPLISHDGIIKALEGLADDLCIRLDQQDAGARDLKFSIYRADGTWTALDVRTSRPARDKAHMVALFEPRLDALDAGLGIDVIVLEAREVERLVSRQTALGPRPQCDDGRRSSDQLVDRLVNRLGKDAVFYLAPVAGHIPECSERRMKAIQTGDDISCLTGQRPGGAHFDDGRGRPGSARHLVVNLLSRPRPAFLLRPAEPIDVLAEVPDGPPDRFTWRRVMRRVSRAEGPERIAPEWWHLLANDGDGLCGGDQRSLDQAIDKAAIGFVEDKDNAGREAVAASWRTVKPTSRIRDYYRVEDEFGGAYWIYRAGLYPERAVQARSDGAMNDPPLWYLHGLF